MGGTSGSKRSSFTIQYTVAALSPRLLEILQYREPTPEPTLNDDRRTGSRTSGQRVTGGIMQRFGVVGQVQEGHSPSSPSRSDSVSTTADESWHTTETTFQGQTSSDPSPKPINSAWNPSESKVTILKTLVRPGDSSPTIVGGSENQCPAPADSGINRRTSNVRYSRGDGDMRKVGETRKSRPQPVPQGQQPGAYDHDSPAFPSLKIDRDPAVLNLNPLGIEPTSTQSSSIRRKGECTIPMIMSCD